MIFLRTSEKTGEQMNSGSVLFFYFFIFIFIFLISHCKAGQNMLETQVDQHYLYTPVTVCFPKK